MARRNYLIAYDISDDKRRNGVFKTLDSQGDHVQYSVFLCSLNARELAVLRADLKAIIHARDDQVILLDFGATRDSPEPLLECLGKPYNPPARVQVF